MRRLWQSTMIRLARMDGLTRFVQSWRATSSLARRYVAGRSVDAAVQRARRLFDDKGLRASLFYLGEYVTDPQVIKQTLAQKIAASESLAGAGLDVHVSVDTTQIGQMIDAGVTRQNAAHIVQGLRNTLQDNSPVAHRVNVLMFDMEDATVIDDTIAHHDGLADQGDAVALTMQAYHKRTEAHLTRQHTARRKGAFGQRGICRRRRHRLHHPREHQGQLPPLGGSDVFALSARHGLLSDHRHP